MGQDNPSYDAKIELRGLRYQAVENLLNSGFYGFTFDDVVDRLVSEAIISKSGLLEKLKESSEGDLEDSEE